MASPQEIQFTTSSQTGEVFLRRAKVTRDGSLEAQPIPDSYDYKWELLKPIACRGEFNHQVQHSGDKL